MYLSVRVRVRERDGEKDTINSAQRHLTSHTLCILFTGKNCVIQAARVITAGGRTGKGSAKPKEAKEKN